MDDNQDTPFWITRRLALGSSTATTALLFGGFPQVALGADDTAAEPVSVELSFNGRDYALRLDPRTTLLDALRDHLAMTGSKKGCDHGQCGACTVLDGHRINSCLTLAVMHDGQSITTIERFSDGAALSPLQAAFIEHDGFQCGITPDGDRDERPLLLGAYMHFPTESNGF